MLKDDDDDVDNNYYSVDHTHMMNTSMVNYNNNYSYPVFDSNMVVVVDIVDSMRVLDEMVDSDKLECL